MNYCKFSILGCENNKYYFLCMHFSKQSTPQFCNSIWATNKIKCWILRHSWKVCFRPRPHVSGDFCISNFFYADTKISAHPIRIRTSRRISQQSMRITKKAEPAIILRLVLILWRQRIQKYTDTSVHTYPDTQRIQKFPLWRAYTEISGYTERIRRTRVDARCIRIKKFVDTKISGYVWTGP